MDPNNPQNQTPFNPKTPISEVLKQEKEGFTPSDTVRTPTLKDTVEAMGAGFKTDPNQNRQSRIIKTYKTDAEEAMRSQGGSVIKVAVAENEIRNKKPTPVFVPKAIPIAKPAPPLPPPIPKQPTPTPPLKKAEPLTLEPEPIPVYRQETESKPKKKLFVPVLVVVILLALGGAAIPVAQYFLNQKKTPVAVVNESTIIPFDNKGTIVLDKTDHNSLSSAINKLPANNAKIEYVSVFQNILDANQKTIAVKVPTNTFATLIGPNMPSALARSFDGDYMYGTDNAKKSTPFILFKTSSYDQTFAGMLKWEKNMSMISDLTPILNLPDSTTTQSFTDKIITSKDVRAIVLPDGTLVFLYGFIDNQTLLITTNAETFQDLSNRYVTAHFVQ